MPSQNVLRLILGKNPQVQGSKHGHVTKKTHSSMYVVSLFPNTAHFW